MKSMAILVLLIFFIPSISSAQSEWAQQNSGTTEYLRDLQFLNENIGWVVGYSGVILKTTDGGTNWITQNSGTSLDLITVFFIDEQMGWVGGRNGLLLKTSDSGTNWSSTQIGLGNEDIYSLEFIDENIGLAVIGKVTPYYYGFIIKTTDGGNNWQTKFGINNEAFLDIEINNQYGWTVGTSIIFHTTNYGESWNEVYNPSGQWLFDVLFMDQNTGWAVGGLIPEVILKSNDGGNNWYILTEFYEYKRLYGAFFYDLNNGWIVGEQGLIRNTTDGGMSWNFQSTPTSHHLRQVQFPSESVGYIVGENGVILKYSEYSNLINILAPNGGEIITAGSTYFIEWNSQSVEDVKIEYSTDNGTSWINVIDSIPSVGIYQWTVPNTFTTEGRIKISDITDPNIYDISDASFTIQSSKSITVMDPNGGEIIYGGSQYEVLWSSNDVEFVKLEYSINNGASWNIIIDSTQSTGVYLWTVPNILTTQARMKISDRDLPSIYDVSDESFRINYIVSVLEDYGVNEFTLMQNYPNPFNPTTSIIYSVPEKSFVKLNVYDILGNLVKALVSEEKSAGEYRIDFNASEIPSGIYYYQLTTINFTDTKKMLLLK